MLALALLCGGCGQSTPDSITVFAAASLAEVLTAIGEDYRDEHGVEVHFSFSASSTATRQVLAGAPADVLVVADPAWLEDLPAGWSERSILAGNQLVLVLARHWQEPVHITESAPAFTRLALADPAHVPAGRYAKEALQALNWWEALAATVIPTADVRAALRAVQLGHVDAAIVYASDCMQLDLTTCAIPGSLHQAIHYAVAVRAQRPAAQQFLALLTSSTSQQRFAAFGFTHD